MPEPMSPRDALGILERMSAAAPATRQDHVMTIEALNVIQAIVVEKEIAEREQGNAEALDLIRDVEESANGTKATAKK